MIVIHREQKRKQLLNFATPWIFWTNMVRKTNKNLYEICDFTVLPKRLCEVQNVF